MQRVNEERVSTGDQNLDLLIQGGFPRGSLILLAGNPGVGKTVFSANFICKGVREFNESGIYVSLAEDKETFYDNISKHFNIKCEECQRRNKCIFLDYVTVKEEGISAMLESIIKEVMKVNAKRLVIDSFTAITQAFKEPFETRIILHTIIGKIVRMTCCTTLLICEVPFGTNMIAGGMEEFVADGVIVLKSSKLEERLFRDLEIKKLRGTFIGEREVSFTLEKGFQVIPPFQLKMAKEPSKYEPVPHPPGKFATASPDLNRILGGGFQAGTIAYLEVGEDVSFEQTLYSVLLPLQWNFIGNGQPIIGMPSPGLDHKIILESMMNAGFSKEELNRLVKFIELIYLRQIGEEQYVINIKGRNLEEDLEIVIGEILKIMHESRKPLLLILSANTLASYYGLTDSLKALSVLSAVTREKNSSLMLILLKPGFKRLGKILGAMADTHLKIIREHGAVFLYGTKPRTPLYAVNLDNSKGYPIPKLTPII